MHRSDLPAGDGEFALLDLVAMIRRRWRALLLPVVGALLVAIIYMHLATYKYQAELAVAPPQTSSSASLSGALGGNLGGLAALAGVGGASGGGGLNFQLYREAIFQRQTAETLAREPWVMQTIFQSDWDAARQSWAEPAGPLRRVRNSVIALLGIRGRDWSAPDAAKLQEYIGERVKVATSSKTPVVTISFEHPDPVFAARFLNRIHVVVDNNLKARLLSRTSENIDYISMKLQQVTIAEHRQALAQALSEQEKLRMTASSSVSFAAEPFGKAASSRRPVSPNPLIVLAAAIGAGLVIGMIAVLWLEFGASRARGTGSRVGIG